MIYVVIRKATLMEDEGHIRPIKAYKTRAAAEEWIKSQEREFFSSSDYFLWEVEFSAT